MGQGSADQTSGVSVNPMANLDMNSSQFCVAAEKPKNHTGMILLATCVAAVGVVYVLGLSQKPKEDSAEVSAYETQVDTALAKLVDKQKNSDTQELISDAGKMVEMFYQFPVAQQVEVDKLQKNPFSLTTKAEAKLAAIQAAKPRQQIEKELTHQASTFHLQSILDKPTGAKCLINGEVFGEGSKVNKQFEVKTIERDKVILIAEDMEFVLRI